VKPLPSIRRLSSGVAAAILLFAAPLFADPSATDRAAAEALFSEGRRLLSEGKYPQACAKLEASQKLDPGAGTLLNLGDCQEKNGQTASAWGTFNMTASLATKNGDTARSEEATRRAGLVEPRLSRLMIIMDPSDQPSGIALRMDGRSIETAIAGSAIPVDPGEHTLEVNAPGRQPWKTTVKIEAKPGITKVTVTTGQPTPSTPPPSPPATRSVVPAVVMGSLAVVGVGTGVATLALRAGKASDARTLSDQIKKDHGQCVPGAPGHHPLCGKLADTASNGDTFGTVSIVGFVIGGAAAAGTLTYLLWPKQPSPFAVLRVTPALGAAGGGLMASGTF
jgi:hypothetical protein